MITGPPSAGFGEDGHYVLKPTDGVHFFGIYSIRTGASRNNKTNDSPASPLGLH